MTSPFLSICIPSYNRPLELIRLLDTINIVCKEDIEIVICEDLSPKRAEIRSKIESYIESSPLNIRYFENEKNYGYDKNLRSLIEKAVGDYIIFMGDDDLFQTENLPLFINFLKAHNNLGYILKTHTFIHKDGQKELFKYFPTSKFFEPGAQAIFTLFRKSVLISGFCFKRTLALPYLIDKFDGTLLFQLYILAEIVYQYPSAYLEIPITIQNENLRNIPMFGSSEVEKGLYKPGEITIDNSVNFMKGFFKISKYIDEKYSINFSKNLSKDFSKYSYPVLSIQRTKGAKEFRNYCKRLNAEIQLNSTVYFYIYYYALIIFGKGFCDKTIIYIKKIIGHTPKL